MDGVKYWLLQQVASPRGASSCGSEVLPLTLQKAFQWKKSHLPGVLNLQIVFNSINEVNWGWTACEDSQGLNESSQLRVFLPFAGCWEVPAKISCRGVLVGFQGRINCLEVMLGISSNWMPCTLYSPSSSWEVNCAQVTNKHSPCSLCCCSLELGELAEGWVLLGLCCSFVFCLDTDYHPLTVPGACVRRLKSCFFIISMLLKL